MGDNFHTDEAAWKLKYFRHLERYEQEEASWQKTEELLRRSLSRVSLAAEGLDPELDTQLQGLRKAIRQGVNRSELAHHIELLSQALTKVEDQGAGSAVRTPAEAVAVLIDKVVWPRALHRRSKSLRKQLQKAIHPAQLPPLLDDCVALLRDGVTLDKPTDNNENPSLWNRFFANGRGDEERPNLDQQESSGSPLALATTVLQTIVRVFEDHDDFPATRVEALEKQLNTVSQPHELKVLATDIALLLGARRQPHPEGKKGLTGSAELIPSFANELFIELLERMSLPGEVESEAAALRKRLSSPVDKRQWPSILEKFCDLVAAMRRNVQEEKRDLEHFLSQLTGRLKELDDRLQGAQSGSDRTLINGQALNNAVEEQVSGLASTIQQAVELDDLKQNVQDRLEQIRRHMDAYREEEERRIRTADEQMQFLNQRLHGLEEEADALRSRIQEQRQRALRDTLTGINNRLAFDERLDQEYSRWKRFREPVSLTIWDVDRFKHINDTYGHQVGDRVLAAIAKLLASHIREADFIARYGGEEFVIVMPGTGAEDALAVAEKLRDKIATSQFQYAGTPVAVTVSCGIAEFSEGSNPERLFEAADRALYQAKEQGRNRCMQAVAAA